MVIKLGVKLDPASLAATKRELAKLRASVQKKALRRGTRKAARVVAKRAKQTVPVETRTLQKSLGAQVKTIKGAILGIVGVRKGFARTVKVKVSGGGKGRGKKARYRQERRDPVEYGPTVNARTRFLARALESSQSEVEAIIAREVRAEVER